MNIQVHIDALKYKLQQGSASRDRRYADSFLKHMLVAARKTLIKRRLEKGDILPDNFYKFTCIDFEDSPYHNCNCATGTCLFKTSVKLLPNIVSYKGDLLLNIMNLNGDIIEKIDLAVVKYRGLYALNNNVKGRAWHIKNRKIVMLNDSKLQKGLARYVPLDFDEDYNMEANCSNNSNSSNACFTDSNDIVFYDDDATLYNMAYELIIGKSQDKLNNSTDDTIPTNLR